MLSATITSLHIVKQSIENWSISLDTLIYYLERTNQHARPVMLH